MLLLGFISRSVKTQTEEVDKESSLEEEPSFLSRIFEFKKQQTSLVIQQFSSETNLSEVFKENNIRGKVFDQFEKGEN